MILLLMLLTLDQSVFENQKAPEIVVGVVDETGRHVITRGRADGDTIFEIGSITKVFTAMLLEDMVTRGEVTLTDPISKFLPEGVKAPQFEGKPITLEHLARHTSGLPRLPSNLKPADMQNPYADYTVEKLYAFLSTYELPRAPGASEEYSNLGGGLLGHLLARRAGTDYETLVRQRILEPLAMKSTAITLTPSMRARLASGHDEQLRAAKNWDLPVLAGAGALRSTANDMLTFVEAAIHRKPGLDLGWQKTGTILWHNGGTGGYRSFIALDRTRKVGVVVLSNSANGVDQLGIDLITRLR
jgi:D-alanyl-D-alanine-carboxypeptidase/D-alanyl-D-alanine-endopeptidase